MPPMLLQQKQTRGEDAAEETPTGPEIRIHNRPSRIKKKPNRYVPTLDGNRYAETEGQIHINTEVQDLQPMTDEETREHVLGIIMAQQHTLHTGLRKFGSKGKQAVLKELEQLQDMQAYTHVEAASLTAAEKKRAVESIMLLIEKKRWKNQRSSCWRRQKTKKLHQKGRRSITNSVIRGHHDYVGN